MKKIILYLKDLNCKILILFTFFLLSCNSAPSNELDSMLDSYYYDPISHESRSVFLLLDLGSCGKCVDEVILQLKNDIVSKYFNIIPILEQKAKYELLQLDSKIGNVVFVKEEDFLKISSGYGIFILFYKDNDLLSINKLNSINTKEFFQIGIEFLEVD
ncbi:hypothetical protein Aoki45_39280 [Algoriphagus sp. oki45]|uniref:hypothetical protein n=1 Tax=Algoriphagus sp. oki45 TaxID=3067294 RepID=UPI0027F2BBDA|nr:hypothetical protein Aoki45_39280 [Algoriphagus sp. oki45]